MQKLFSLPETVDLKENSKWLIAVVIILLIFIMAARTPMDTDLFWHLRSGQASLQAGHPIIEDQFSYTRAGAAWTNHSYLSQIALYGLYQLGGYLAIAALVGLLATASLAIVYMQMIEPVLLRAFVVVLAALVMAPVWVPRPELASLVLLAGVGYLLYLYKWKQADRLWLLVPIFMLWSNLHGGYVLGLALSGAMVAGEVLNILLGSKGPEILSFKRILRLAVWIAAAALATLVNPNGIRIWLVPFQTVGIGALQNYIMEWASPDFHQLYQQPFIWMLVALIASLGLSKRRVDGTDLVSLVIFTFASLFARRNFGPFAIVASPILCRYLWSAITDWGERIKPVLENFLARFRLLEGLAKSNHARVTGRTRLINFAIVAFLAVVGMMRLYLVTSPDSISSFEKEISPVGAVAWIEANHPQGNLFNSYNWGGYLIWTLRDYPVFVDGRTDLYSDEIIGQWLQVVNASVGWQSVINKWNINLILIEPSWPIAKILPYEGWKILYKDQMSVLFGR